MIQYMRCDIAMIKSYHTVILLKDPVSIPTLPMDYEIKANTYLGFVNNSTQFTVNFSATIKTSCYENICDRQRVKGCLNNKVSGCYGMSTNSTSLVIQHSISVQIVQYESFQMDEYSSFKFSKLYLNTDITVSCKLYILQLTESLMLVFTAMEYCVDLINNN